MKLTGALLVAAVCLTGAVHARSATNDCEPGHIKDLDGVTCVKKVTFPPRSEKKSCPDPAIANGNIFFKMGGRMVDFYCDTDYVMVPDNPVSICQITGMWSKQIPVCLKPGCQAPEAPASGMVELEYESTLASFYCNPGYALQGSAKLGCEDGTSWNATAPVCVEIKLQVKDDGGSSGSGIQGFSASLLIAMLLLLR